MKRSKKIFLFAAAVFFLVIAYVAYDISSKTTFPGSKGLLRESLAPSDSVGIDSLTSEPEIK